MKTLSPFLRLLVITLFVLIVVFLSVVGLRLVASSGPPQLAQLPETGLKPLIFAFGDNDVAESASLKAYEATLALGERVVPVVEVRPTVDHDWVLFYPRRPEVTEGLARLSDLLERYQPKKLMVIVHSREVAAASSVLAVLGERPEPMQTFIYSPNHRVNRELRKKRPLWLSGGDASQLAQWHVFAALWLEPMVGTDFDWLLKGGTLGHQSEFSPRVRDELARRRIGEIQVLETGDEPIDQSLYGVLTNRPTALLRRL